MWGRVLGWGSGCEVWGKGGAFVLCGVVLGGALRFGLYLGF